LAVAKFSGEPPKITVKHVLVKYKGSKRADDKIARSRGEACLRAIEARDKVRNGDDWDAVVKDYSDEAGAATRGGSIGAVERKDVAKPFADAAFELKPNQMSDVVETEFGFHVILRTE
jgi:parvulin-like peptidyl-prolyl isomerase